MSRSDISRFYDSFHRKNSSQYRVINKLNFTYYKILNIIEKYLPRNKHTYKILDYGCGTGALSLYFGSKGYQVVGYDISLKAIEMAKDNVAVLNFKNVIFSTDNSFLKSLKDSSVDAIICIEVIEHVKNDTDLLREFYRILKKGGLLFLTTPSSSAPLYKLGLLNKFDKEVGHIRRYSQAMLSNKLHDNGYQILEMGFHESIIRNALFTFNKISFLIRFIRGILIRIFTYFDDLMVRLTQGSNLYVVCTKK